MEKGAKNKLGRKKIKKLINGARPLRVSNSDTSTPRRSRHYSPDQSQYQDSPPFSLLSSQVPNQEKEVFWDYDTPQIKKYRSRMGVGVQKDDEGSPVHLAFPTKVSTPRLKLQCQFSRPSEVAYMDTSGAKAVFNELKAFSLELERKKRQKSAESTAGRISPAPLADLVDASEAGNSRGGDSSLFSDDDSLLIQCTQEAEHQLLNTCDNSVRQTNQDQANHSDKVNTDCGFDSDDSFDMMMSQMDEQELITGPEKVELKNNSFKRFKSSDDGITRKSSLTLKRFQSSPLIHEENEAEKQRRLCSQEEIEKKKLEAKRRRELSQVKRF